MAYMQRGPTFTPTPSRASARTRLLDTARTLFYQRGVNNVGIDEILRESGVAKATLYKHFQNKDALILEFMRQGDERWLLWLSERVAALEPDPARRPLAVFDVLQEWFALPRFRGCLLTNAAVELADPLHAAHDLLRVHKARVREYLQTLLQGAGHPDPETGARTLQLLIEGATLQARTQQDPQVAQEARAMARTLLGL